MRLFFNLYFVLHAWIMDTFTCGVCFDEISYEDIALIGCEHLYCRECLHSYLVTEVENKKLPIKCPDPSCYYILEESDIVLLLKPEELTLYYNNSLERVIDNTKNMIHCPKADCKGVIEVVSRYFNCPICNYKMCVKCNGDYHEKEECPEKNDVVFEKYLKVQKFTKCPNCSIPVDRISGCNKITCKCGIFFCYTCGKDITIEKYNHFNKDHSLWAPEHHPSNALNNANANPFNPVIRNVNPQIVNNANPPNILGPREYNINGHILAMPNIDGLNLRGPATCEVFLVTGPRQGQQCGKRTNGPRFCSRHKEADLNRPRYNPNPEAICTHYFRPDKRCKGRQLYGRTTCHKHTRR